MVTAPTSSGITHRLISILPDYPFVNSLSAVSGNPKFISTGTGVRHPYDSLSATTSVFSVFLQLWGDDDDVNMLFDGISSVFDSLESKENTNTDMEEEAYEATIKKESRKKRKNSEQMKQFMELLLLLKLKVETKFKRLRNKDSKLFFTLKQFDTKHRTLLTGTPLQTSIPQSTDYKYPLNCDYFLRTNYVNIFCSKDHFVMFLCHREKFGYVSLPQLSFV
ncbi:unnamed protein product [Lactuca virosa]|uniref:SNF2 N-terminal domain-containing protein n=1 Tax=Lactuca virosa TaxID=75947 RepID=A0AAU9PEK8_9ASTR|nr:unnamed protein product [Lactuca virosa]